jgi:hypothetical protein
VTEEVDVGAQGSWGSMVFSEVRVCWCPLRHHWKRPSLGDMCNKEFDSARCQFLQHPRGTDEMDRAPGAVGVSPMRARQPAGSVHTSPNASRCNFARSMLSSWVSIFGPHAVVGSLASFGSNICIRKFHFSVVWYPKSLSSSHKSKWRRRNAKRVCHVPETNITSYGLASLD